MESKHNIWASYECKAWSMGFNYERYVEHHKLWGYTHGLLSEKSYSFLCQALDQSVEEANEL